MINCDQTEGQNVLEHGISVKNYLFDLLNHIRTGENLKYEWRLPKWISPENKNLFIDSLPPDKTLELYTTYHDCGKPFCVTIDENGKKHFPDHASYSYCIFNKVFDDNVAANLILHDMDIHLLKADGIKEFITNDNPITLLLTGLSEIHLVALNQCRLKLNGKI
jgi:hypothetical protein